MPSDTLILKLLATPSLMAAVSLAQRRWGPRVGGLLAGLPLTAGPVSLFLALEQGTGFASTAALGTLVGLIALSGFSLAYALAAERSAWGTSLTVGLTTHVGLTWMLATSSPMTSETPGLFAFVCCTLIAALGLMPGPVAAAPAPPPPLWELPLRLVVSTGAVVLLTGLARLLGPTMSGILSPFPVFAGILAAFTHRFHGGASARHLLEGVLVGSFAYAVFFLIIATFIVGRGIAVSFTLACVAAAVVQGVTVRWLRPRVLATVPS